MSVLVLVRHGQASAGSDDYDRLSPLGEKQAQILGQYWAARGEHFDRVLVGPLRRQRQTHAAVRQAYQRQGQSWPLPETCDALAEHHGPTVLRQAIANGDLEHEGVGAQNAGGSFSEMLKDPSIFTRWSRRWASGEQPTPAELESWSAFRQRVQSELSKIFATTERGQRVVAFTSGGVVAAAVGTVFKLPATPVIELSWRIRNASINEIHFREHQAMLHTLNTVPHLREDRLLTYV